MRDAVNRSDRDYSALLSEVSSEEIVAYLEQSEITISDLEEMLTLENLQGLETISSEDFNSYSEEELDDLYEYYSL